MEGACLRRRLAPPRTKSLVHVADVSQTLSLKFNFQKLVGTPPCRGLVSRRNL
ncbi:hypothetical protein MTR67_040773 [Solanum verrucosum]|uniref:Uncharacterized protein n=1 Tax=Solanum verrucosum TaxID=315347 RepID=A0AAF0ZRP9_SOLVR|nr:hypothetical protein MTR67_040773 [Solanum verrucosum]